MKGKRTLVVHLIGGPGVGKSTISLGVGYHLKLLTAKHGKTVEVVPEVAKEYVWRGQVDALQYQQIMLGRQIEAMMPLLGKVDIMICDGPLVLSCVYAQPEDYTSIHDQVKALHRYFDSVAYYLDRCIPFSQVGRAHTPDQLSDVDKKCMKVAKDFYGWRETGEEPWYSILNVKVYTKHIPATEETSPSQRATQLIVDDLVNLGFV